MMRRHGRGPVVAGQVEYADSGDAGGGAGDDYQGGPLVLSGAGLNTSLGASDVGGGGSDSNPDAVRFGGTRSVTQRPEGTITPADIFATTTGSQFGPHIGYGGRVGGGLPPPGDTWEPEMSTAKPLRAVPRHDGVETRAHYTARSEPPWPD